MKKIIITVTVLLAATMGAAAQTENTMDTSEVTKAVVGGYKAIENGVTSGYKAIENSVVEGYTRVSDAFIMKFFARQGETVEQAKARMKAEEAQLHQQNEDRVAASRKRAQESVERAKAAGQR